MFAAKKLSTKNEDQKKSQPAPHIKHQHNHKEVVKLKASPCCFSCDPDSMKSPSVSLLLGVCVLLLSALTVSAVFAYLPPFTPNRALFQLVMIIPYFISTVLMLLIHQRIQRRRLLAICMEMGLSERAQGCDEDYDDIAGDVTAENVF